MSHEIVFHTYDTDGKLHVSFLKDGTGAPLTLEDIARVFAETIVEAIEKREPIKDERPGKIV